MMVVGVANLTISRQVDGTGLESRNIVYMAGGGVAVFIIHGTHDA